MSIGNLLCERECSVKYQPGSADTKSQADEAGARTLIETRSIHLVDPKRPISHAEAEQTLRRAGYSPKQIEDVLRETPDPIDPERDSETLFKHGITQGTLMDRMGGSP